MIKTIGKAAICGLLGYVIYAEVGAVVGVCLSVIESIVEQAVARARAGT